MTIEVMQVPPIGTNCYLIQDEETGKGVIVDPGGDARGIYDRARAMSMDVSAILLTHGHYDHTGAVAELRQVWEEVPVYLHPADAALMWNKANLMPAIPRTTPYEEGDKVEVGSLTFTVLHTPGHTPGSVVLRVGDVLLTGDTLFQGSCGRTDLPGGAPNQMLQSLRRLRGLAGDFQVCPGHESLSTLEEERQSNYYLLMAARQ